MAYVSRKSYAVAMATLLGMSVTAATAAEEDEDEAEITHPIQQLVDLGLSIEFTWYTGSSRYFGYSRTGRPWPDYRLVEKLAIEPPLGARDREVKLTERAIAVFLQFPEA